MSFYPHSDITIGNFRFNGVNEVRVHKSLWSLTDSAVIVLPGKSTVQKGSIQDNGAIKVKQGTTTTSSAGNLFAAGDAVTINIGWNGDSQEEFRGFVRTIGKGIPVIVECEGYVRQLRQNVTISGTINTPSLKRLLDISIGKRGVDGKLLPKQLTDIQVVCDLDVEFGNIIVHQVSGERLLDYIRKVTDNNIAICFIKPNVLWAGLPFTSYAKGSDPFGAGKVGYRPGWNCMQDGGLRQRVDNEPVKVFYGGKYATGGSTWTKSSVTTGRQKKRMLNSIPTTSLLQTLSNEAEFRYNYKGYEGQITGFLQPFCLPGYKATIVNTYYPELNGDYMVEETEVIFGLGGARRIVKVGPKIGFAQ